jgi:quinol monooxygenase YgiN
MSAEVYWVLELSVQQGLDQLKALMKDMVASTQSEPGTLNYEWNVSEDGRTCHIHERFKDSASVVAHLGTFGAKFAKRFMAALKPVRVVVYGAPDKTAKEALAAMKPQYMAVLGGFKR